MDDVLVIKIGGGAGLDLDVVLRDVARLASQRPVVVVHGVSARMAQLSAARGMAVEMLHSPGGHSSRYTPPPVRDLFVEAALQVNAEVLAGLSRYGAAACGLVDPVAMAGTRKTAIRAVVEGRVRVVRDDCTGMITVIDTARIRAVLERGTVAVIPPLASSADGLLNVDGDRAAGAIAASLPAQTLVILSNVSGLYRHFPDETSRVDQVGPDQFEQAFSWAEGRMKRKVLSALEASAAGVGRIVVADGRISQPVTQALRGEGTVFTHDRHA